jgi:hypothetical protein
VPGKEIAVTLIQEQEEVPSLSSKIHSSFVHQPRFSAKRKEVDKKI